MKDREELKKTITRVCKIINIFNSGVTITKERKCGTNVRTWSEVL